MYFSDDNIGIEFYKLYKNYNHFLKPNLVSTGLANWFNDSEQSGFNAFAITCRSFEAHNNLIFKYFDGSSTNATAESFNGKIKDSGKQF
ncbi:transposase [Carboxylicivirga sediminis]|uniref:Transposase n=1 Tax=Carboxylicivirga sediminis TaxID=2006564 RepID=A0A941F4F4_9BACT|nr:transposase [Carboxylicivirga sediminis]